MSDNLYLPSNGTEGDWFMDFFCYKCAKEKRCPIIVKTMTGEHTEFWVYNSEKQPVCTNSNRWEQKIKSELSQLNNQIYSKMKYLCRRTYENDIEY